MHKSIARFALLVGLATLLPAGVRAQSSPDAFNGATLEVTSEWTGQDRGDGSGSYKLITRVTEAASGITIQYAGTPASA